MKVDWGFKNIFSVKILLQNKFFFCLVQEGNRRNKIEIERCKIHCKEERSQ